MAVLGLLPEILNKKVAVVSELAGTVAIHGKQKNQDKKL
jgi:hypothetical protein